MCASVLGFEAVMLALSCIIMISVEDVAVGTSLTIGLGLAVVALIIAGLLRFERAYYVGFAYQLAVIATGALIVIMFVIGAIFAGLWTASYVVGRKIEAEQAARQS